VSSAKEEILALIRANGQKDSREAEYAAIPRNYRQTGTLSKDERIALLADRLHDYGCAVHRCPEAEIATCVGDVLRGRGKTRLLITPEIPADWLPNNCELLADSGLGYDELDRVDGVLTRCALAIAATGTIVLRHAPDTGRRALTLVPDYHLCIVFESQVVELVPEAMQQMRAYGRAPLTTISGPSATSDIEMTRIQGVHGPRTLDIIFVK
jgi:L-lactate dehydrogenase complex protein LldG